MGKLGKFGQITDQHISDWYNDGWRFSVKQVGKYSYIRRRKKGEKDQQVAPYNEAMWEKIKDLQESPKLRHTEIKRLQTDAHKALKDTRADIKRGSCRNNVEGFCTYWSYKPGSRFIEIFRELNQVSGRQLFQTRDADEGLVHVTAIRDVCLDCPCYARR